MGLRMEVVYISYGQHESGHGGHAFLEQHLL